MYTKLFSQLEHIKVVVRNYLNGNTPSKDELALKNYIPIIAAYKNVSPQELLTELMNLLTEIKSVKQLTKLDNNPVQLEFLLNLEPMLLDNMPWKNDSARVEDIIKKIGPDIFRYAGDELKNNENFILRQIESKPRIFLYASERLYNDKQFVIKALQCNRDIFPMLSRQLKNNKKFILNVLDNITNYTDFYFRYLINCDVGQDEDIKTKVNFNNNARYYRHLLELNELGIHNYDNIKDNCVFWEDSMGSYIIQQRKRLENKQMDPNKPVVVTFQARSDDNGAFKSKKEMYREFIEKKIQWLFFEVSTVTDMVKEIDFLIDKLPAGQEINIQIQAHGSPYGIALGSNSSFNQDERLCTINAHKLEKLQELNVKRLIFDSCSTGSSVYGDFNISSICAGLIKPDCLVIAPKYVAGNNDIRYTFTSTGNIRDVRFIDKMGIDYTFVTPGNYADWQKKMDEQLFRLVGNVEVESISQEIDFRNTNEKTARYNFKQPVSIDTENFGKLSIKAIELFSIATHSYRIYLNEPVEINMPVYGNIKIERYLLFYNKNGLRVISEGLETPLIIKLPFDKRRKAKITHKNGPLLLGFEEAIDTGFKCNGIPFKAKFMEHYGNCIVFFSRDFQLVIVFDLQTKQFISADEVREKFGIYKYDTPGKTHI